MCLSVICVKIGVSGAGSGVNAIRGATGTKVILATTGSSAVLDHLKQLYDRVL